MGKLIYPPTNPFNKIQFTTINKTPTCFGTVPKHPGVMVIVMNYILWIAFVGRCIDWKNMHGMNNIKFECEGVKCIA